MNICWQILDLTVAGSDPALSLRAVFMGNHRHLSYPPRFVKVVAELLHKCEGTRGLQIFDPLKSFETLSSAFTFLDHRVAVKLDLRPVPEDSTSLFDLLQMGRAAFAGVERVLPFEAKVIRHFLVVGERMAIHYDPTSSATFSAVEAYRSSRMRMSWLCRVRLSRTASADNASSRLAGSLNNAATNLSSFSIKRLPLQPQSMLWIGTLYVQDIHLSTEIFS